MNCTRCGSPLRPLFTSTFCPNGCDKIPPGPSCPGCGSTETEPFKTDGFGLWLERACYHCWPCGHVWTTGSDVDDAATD